MSTTIALELVPKEVPCADAGSHTDAVTTSQMPELDEKSDQMQLVVCWQATQQS